MISQSFINYRCARNSSTQRHKYWYKYNLVNIVINLITMPCLYLFNSEHTYRWLRRKQIGTDESLYKALGENQVFAVVLCGRSEGVAIPNWSTRCQFVYIYWLCINLIECGFVFSKKYSPGVTPYIQVRFTFSVCFFFSSYLLY